MSDLTTTQQEAIRAALGLGGPAAQPQTQGPEDLLREWADDLGLAPGDCPAGSTSDLYWIFEDWRARRYPGQPRVDHWTFAVELRRLGLGRKRRIRGAVRTHLFKRQAADLCLVLRDRLGPREQLDWRVGALPAAYRNNPRHQEHQDDEYRKRKIREARRRRDLRAGRAIGARAKAAAASYQLRTGGRPPGGGNPGPGPASDPR